jgi:hypothetical protein
LGGQLPKGDEVLLVALDGEGKRLGTERLGTERLSVEGLAAGDVESAGKRITAFLKKYSPPVADAQAKLAAARADAERSGRLLWIVAGGPRCGPCFRLARWLDEQHALLEKDYVIVKVMLGLDQHAMEVVEPLNHLQTGVPWYAITDTDGKVLATSEGPSGNVGMPNTPEGVGHVREMLSKTARHLTAEDLERLAESLAKFK